MVAFIQLERCNGDSCWYSEMSRRWSWSSLTHHVGGLLLPARTRTRQQASKRRSLKLSLGESAGILYKLTLSTVLCLIFSDIVSAVVLEAIYEWHSWIKEFSFSAKFMRASYKFLDHVSAVCRALLCPRTTEGYINYSCHMLQRTPFLQRSYQYCKWERHDWMYGWSFNETKPRQLRSSIISVKRPGWLHVQALWCCIAGKLELNWVTMTTQLLTFRARLSHFWAGNSRLRLKCKNENSSISHTHSDEPPLISNRRY